MATFEDYLFVKNTKWVVWGLCAFIVALLIFDAGVIVGSHRAPGPRGGVRPMMEEGFIPGGHGAVGTIQSISLPNLTLHTRDGATQAVYAGASTTVTGDMPGTTTTASLQVGDTVIVIGDPSDTDDQGMVDARFIRILLKQP